MVSTRKSNAKFDNEEKIPLKAKKAKVKALQENRCIPETITVSVTTTEASVEGISQYEQARLENIRRNERFLSELGISGVKNSITVAKQTLKKTSSLKRMVTPKVLVMPSRRSSRVTVDRLSAEIKQLQEEGKEEEAQQKQEMLDAMIAKQKEGSYEVDAVEAEDTYARFPIDPIPLLRPTTSSDDDQNNNNDNEQIQLEQEITSLNRAFAEANLSLVSSHSESVSTTTTSRSARKKSTTTTTSKSSAPPSSSSSSSEKTLGSTASDFQHLQLHAEDVVKLTPSRITAVTFHPSTTRMMAAAGDKNGNIGIWDVDYASYHSQEAMVTTDQDNNSGIYKYQPHISNIVKLDFHPSLNQQLYSFSYDGTIRCLDLTRSAFLQVFEAPEGLRDMSITDAFFLPNSLSDHTIIISKTTGEISSIDLRTSRYHNYHHQQYTWSAAIHESKVSSVQAHPQQPYYILTASNRSGIKLHDLRKLSTTNTQQTIKPIFHLTNHTKAINAAYYSPDGKYIVSVGLDDRIGIYESSSLTASSSIISSTMISHNNFTGRWLSTFKPAFDPKRILPTFMMGSMLQPRRLEIFTIQSSKDVRLTYNLSGDYLQSVNSRNCFHPNIDAILGSNSSGKVHLFR
jgi:WD repeat-containing protein 76